MLNSNLIIQQGETAKFQMEISREGFSMLRDDFTVILSWGMRNESLTIRKTEMLQNDRGETFFSFPSGSMTGRVDAECRYHVPDTDMPGGSRLVVDRQPLAYVAASGRMPIYEGWGLYDGSHVTYTRRHASGLFSIWSRLRDIFGRSILDAEGRALTVKRAI